jgi:hypothetical protein
MVGTEDEAPRVELVPLSVPRMRARVGRSPSLGMSLRASPLLKPSLLHDKAAPMSGTKTEQSTEGELVSASPDHPSTGAATHASARETREALGLVRQQGRGMPSLAADLVRQGND